jgi:lipopolysaccharide transport system ATP-binding protein
LETSIAIKIKSLGKKYSLGKIKSSSFRENLSFFFRDKTSIPSHEEFWALKNINLEISKGDIIGIVGKNGAGKSTLLKLLSQITKPTEGTIEINGRIASLLEVGTGFHPELTGRENIYLNGTILGMSRKEVKEKFDEIVSFSGVEKFIDTAVKHYSSGMYVRLAFAVAAHLEPEILIIDEVLAVGDAEFQKKCLGKMQDVAKHGRTVLFVSHNMAAVKELCNKGILLQQGQLKAVGSVDEIISEYIKTDSNTSIYIPENPKENIPIAFKRIRVINADQEICTDFTVEDKITLSFEFETRDSKHNYSLFVIINNKYGAPVFSAETPIMNDVLNLEIDALCLTRGNYSIHTFIHKPRIEQIDIAKDICAFNITDATSPLSIHGEYEYGSTFGNYKWKTNDNN